jgi:hypothetical protein
VEEVRARKVAAEERNGTHRRREHPEHGVALLARVPAHHRHAERDALELLFEFVGVVLKER